MTLKRDKRRIVEIKEQCLSWTETEGGVAAWELGTGVMLKRWEGWVFCFALFPIYTCNLSCDTIFVFGKAIEK